MKIAGLSSSSRAVYGRLLVFGVIGLCIVVGQACGGSSDGDGSLNTPTSGDGGAAGLCKTDEECVAKAPLTEPPGCAVSKCDPRLQKCFLSARDADGDGHLSANCRANDGSSIATDGDCDDADKTTFPGAPDVCDGKDHTCGSSQCTCNNGAKRPCYTGAPATREVGICKDGTNTCVKGKWSDACEDETLPARSEVCDGTDYFCDNKQTSKCTCVDGVTRACYTGSADSRLRGLCKDGVQTCTGGDWGSCAGETTPQPTDFCDGQDENCDGIINTPTAPSNCTCANGAVSQCNASACNPTTVTCASGMFPSCPQPEPRTTWCYDGDGDGFCAKSYATVATCGANPNVCPAEFPTCSAPSAWRLTTAAPQTDCDDKNVTTSPTGIEVCDGIDNNCNAIIDEGDPGDHASCASGLPGACANGFHHCVGGAIKCVGNSPSTEGCDPNKDLNCNGRNGDGSGCLTRVYIQELNTVTSQICGGSGSRFTGSVHAYTQQQPAGGEELGSFQVWTGRFGSNSVGDFAALMNCSFTYGGVTYSTVAIDTCPAGSSPTETLGYVSTVTAAGGSQVSTMPWTQAGSGFAHRFPVVGYAMYCISNQFPGACTSNCTTSPNWCPTCGANGCCTPTSYYVFQ